MEITKYEGDTGDRDMTEKRYDKDMPFIEVLQKAVQLKAPLIVKTSYMSVRRPGAWYIKGQGSNLSHDEIRSLILQNMLTDTHSRRVCYLIKYDD